MKKPGFVSKLFGGRSRPKAIGGAIFALAFAVIGVVVIMRILAAGETMYLLPATANVQTGNDVTITVRMNAGTGGVNSVEANVGYDQTKLQFKSIDGTASAFPMALIGAANNGNVNIVRGITGGNVTGDVEVAKVTFTAISSTATTASLSISGLAANAGTPVNLTFTGATVNITASAPATTTSFTIEPSAAAPIVNTSFGLKVYVTSTAVFQGGEVSVNLPAGLSYNGTLDTAGTAFNPATTVTGTTAQLVKLVFVTQSTTMTGKQLIATIPVTGTTTGAKSVTFTGARLVNASNADILPITANPFNITINAASLPAPTISLTGGSSVTTTVNVTNLKQSFTIGNFDSTATYAVTLGGTNLPVTNGTFAIASSIKNGDLPLLISTTKSGASGNSSFTIKLRSPNVNRVECVELLDLLLVNKGYGAASTELDLNFDNTVSIVDLLTVTTNWGGACI